MAIEEIEIFLSQRPRQYQVYLDDLLFKRAIERNFGIIGEAMSKILQLDADIAITNAKNIKGTRNYVVHAYDTLEPHIIWNIAIIVTSSTRKTELARRRTKKRLLPGRGAADFYLGLSAGSRRKCT